MASIRVNFPNESAFIASRMPDSDVQDGKFTSMNNFFNTHASIFIAGNHLTVLRQTIDSEEGAAE
mgnify:CR=1 FL=1